MQEAGDRREDDQGADGPRGRIERLLGGRPLSVYGVLLAGIGVLVVLLAIVYWTGRGSGTAETPTCLRMTPDEALKSINDGLVERMKVLTEEGRPERGPLAVTLDLVDGNCRQLPEGIPAQRDLYQIIGYVTVFNQSRAGEQRINLSWDEQPDIPASLLATATPTPTVTPIPTPTALPTETPLPPTATPPPPTETPTPVPPTPTPVPPTPTPVPPPPMTTTTAISAPIVDSGTPGPPVTAP